MSSMNPYAPLRGLAGEVPAAGTELASRGARLGAVVLDSIVAFVMIWLPALSLLAATGLLEDSADVGGTTFATAALLSLSGFIAWVWITALLVARNGQTIGKRLVDIKVLRSDGSPASLGRLFWLRNVANVLLGVIPLYALIDLLLIFGERRQCVHDLIADTIVVQA